MKCGAQLVQIAIEIRVNYSNWSIFWKEIYITYPRQLCASTKTCGQRSIWWPAVSMWCRRFRSGEKMGRYRVSGRWCFGNARLRSPPLALLLPVPAPLLLPPLPLPADAVSCELLLLLARLFSVVSESPLDNLGVSMDASQLLASDSGRGLRAVFAAPAWCSSSGWEWRCCVSGKNKSRRKRIL